MSKNVTNNRVGRANYITWLGLFINIILTFFKIAAGIVGKSTAMIADALHSFSDFATDIIVLLGFRIVGKPIDKTHDYGHGKVETLVAGIIGAGLFIVGIRIFWAGSCSVFKILQGQTIACPGWIAFYAAVFSIISKEWLYRYTIKIGQEINSPAVIANAWEHRSDAFASIGAMLGIGGAILFGEKWRILDPLAAIAVSLFIFKTAVEISLRSINELVEVSLSDETENKILDIIKAVPGVNEPHDIKTRRIGNYISVDIHIKVDRNLSIVAAHNISTSVEDKIKGAFGEDTFISVHVEPKE